MRPLAAELGVAPRTLLYHFGSKEKLLVEVIRDLRHRQPRLVEILDDPAEADGEQPADRLARAVREIWSETRQPEVRGFLALYFELTSLAIRDPEQYRPLLADVDREWVEQITAYLGAHGVPGDEVGALTDSLLLGYRGALGFALATGRWEAANAAIDGMLDEMRRRLSATG